jgi:hypothetical protein
MKDAHPFSTPAAATKRWHIFAWLFILIADAGFLPWGAMAALAPDYLPGPRSTPILTAGYEGFTNGSWQDLVENSPATADYITALFRVYGAFNVAFAVLTIAITVTAFRRGEGWSWWALLVANTIAFGSAMTYDWIANAIGPFEMLEYVGIIGVYVALAVTAPSLAQRRSA